MNGRSMQTDPRGTRRPGRAAGRPPAQRLRAERHPASIGTPGAGVTVVITCYDYARYLPASVGSALAQDGVAVDVIVVDDASRDDSLQVARDLAAADPRVRVVPNERNLGAVETFNRGLALARSEFVVRLDADDVLTPGSLRRAVAVMQALPRVGLVYGRPIHFSGPELPPARTGNPTSWTVWDGAAWLRSRCVDGTNAITSPEVVMRRSVVDVVGGQLPLVHAHDLEMWLRIAAFCDVAYVNGVDQAWHREHEGSLSTSIEEPSQELRWIRAAFDALCDHTGSGWPDVAGLRAPARRAIARQALDLARRRLDRGQDGPAVDRLCDFAQECAPEVTRSSAWRRVRRARDSRAPRAVRRAMGLLPRARRRMRERARTRRWDRTGVYERMRIVDAGGERR